MYSRRSTRTRTDKWTIWSGWTGCRCRRYVGRCVECVGVDCWMGVVCVWGDIGRSVTVVGLSIAMSPLTVSILTTYALCMTLCACLVQLAGSTAQLLEDTPIIPCSVAESFNTVSLSDAERKRVEAMVRVFGEAQGREAGR